jgi:hypothetical protein
MTIFHLILVFVLVGLVLYLIKRFVPMEPVIYQIMVVIVVIMLIIWSLSIFGVIGALNQPVPKIR